MEKIYVLDTNVLLHDPLAIYAFAEHKVVIPMTVLEELDVIKDRRDKDVSREARVAINTIDKIVGDASLETYKPASQYALSVMKQIRSNLNASKALWPSIQTNKSP